MNKIFITSCLSLSIALSSCSNFLDVKPTNSIEAETSITTASDAKVILNGMMRKLTSSDYYGRNFMLYGDIKGGDFTIASQGRGYDYLYTFNHSESANNFSSVWSQGYNIIAQANNLILNIEKIKEQGSTENFDNFLGQALTTRALVLFDLVRLYGEPYNENKDALGAPFSTVVLGSEDMELRKTVAENYAQILNDLQAAAPLLSKAKSNGYLNYYGNLALQARVHLNMENYDLALAAAEELILSKVYTLYSNDAWKNSWTTQFGSESIFELGMFPSEGDLGNSSLGAYYRRKAHGGSAILGNFVASTKMINLLKADAEDVRLGVMSNDEISSTRMGALYKYSGSTTLSGDKGSANASAVNIKMIRLSEVYLMAAEAALLKGSPDKQKAADYLNLIRKRAPQLDPATEATVSLDLIADERAKELLGEGHRFFDMMRWNKTIEFDDELGNIITIHRDKTIDRTLFKTILPIPLAEINANPGIESQQNPGY